MTGETRKPTPRPVANRPGLPEVRTRVGTHSAFRAALLRGLADANRPGLSELRTRAEGDFTIGLLDAWAAVCDTLTFHTERQANEAYLRTATTRESVRAHARLVGYELAPAKAAGTFLAFEAEAADAPEETLEYPAGLQARSVPRDGEVPLLFETIEPLTARASWNAMTPRMARPQVLDADTDEIMVARTARLAPGDPVVFLQGAVPVAFGSGSAAGFIRRVTSVSDGPDGRRVAALAPDPTGAGPYLFTALMPVLTWTAGTAVTTDSLTASVAQSSWTVSALTTTTAVAQLSLPQLTLAIAALDFAPIAPVEAHVLRVRAGFYGNTAISQRTTPVTDDSDTVVAATYSTTEPAGLDDTAAEVGDTHPTSRYYLYLEREFPEIAAGSVLILRDAINEARVTIHAAETVSVEGYGQAAKVTRLEVNRSGTTPTGGTLGLGIFDTRRTTAFAASERLPLTDLPITDPVGGADATLGADRVELARADLMLLPGKTVAIEGERADLAGIRAAEIRTIADNVLTAGHSVLTFTQPLAHEYLRDTVTICGNVAEATHGETQSETLGDGDATVPFQTFALTSTPLTHVSARSDSGMAPALEVRVDGVRWDRVGDFRDAGPDDAVYMLRIDEDGTARIVFGDGITGRRLPTGPDIVTATYRVGAGLMGHLEAGQISLLASKPAGLKGVRNPRAPSGAADGEALEQARANAPLKVLTLGRVVSLRDYEDFARAFAAVTKARADWTFDGFDRPIFVTVAGQEGALLPEDGEDMTNLRAQLHAAGEADQRVEVRNYAPAGFGLAARLYLDPTYRPQDVLDAARESVLAAFSFAARALGQGVSHAQAIAVLQGVAGVRGVDLDALHRVGQPATRELRLAAAVARPDLSGAEPVAAELLTLDPAALTLEAAE